VYFSVDIYKVDIYDVDMKTKLLSTLVMAAALVSAQLSRPDNDKMLSEAARQLSAANFDAKSPVTVHGTVGTLVWPEGSAGMILVKTDDGQEYAFSTAGVPAMAKQGFTRFGMHPGESITVTGVTTANRSKIGPGFIAARADIIKKSDGSTAFDRAKLPVKQ
jgi:hypothetical protein